MRYLLLALFGLVGIFARYGINSLTVSVLGLDFPAATAAINILGSFLIGLTYVAGIERTLIGEDLRIALMSGLLGGFTTFSAFSLESVAFLDAGRHVLAALYITGTVGGGIFAAIGGLYVGRLVLGGG